MEAKDWYGIIIVFLICIIIFAITNYARPTYCQSDLRVCPDGTLLGRTGPDCTFTPCPDAFTNCVNAGNPVTSTIPRQCLLQNGTTVIERIY